MWQTFFKGMAEWGIWDIISILMSIFPFIAVVWYLWPKTKIDNVYIDATADDGPNGTYSVL